MQRSESVAQTNPQMKKIMRKRAHMIYVRRYIVELMEIINTTIVASTQWNDDVVIF